MSMDRLRQAVDNTIREADGVVHQSKHRGDQAVIYDAARSMLDAPRYYMCFHETYEDRNDCRVWGPDDGQGCGWVLAVRLVDDPQEGGEE